MLSIAIFGFSGKMGQKIFDLIQKDPFLSCKNTKKHSREEIDYLCSSADVLIDFSNRKMLLPLLQAATKTKKPLVIGTTGYTLKEKNMIKKASEKIPLLYSSNFSIGIALFHLLLEKIASNFAKDADIDLIESHHKQKKDAPSGTALSLKETLNSYLPGKEISLHSIRAGSTIGEHKMLFHTKEEQFMLSHRALSRECFAKGALLAAKFLHTKKKGMYTIFDMFQQKRKI